MLDHNGYGPLLSSKILKTYHPVKNRRQEITQSLDKMRAKDNGVKTLDLKLPVLPRARLSACLSSLYYKIRMVFPVVFKNYFPD